MGAFHEGHLELMRQARTLCDTVYVSLFVNPTQFAPNEDFSAYPRDEDRDFALAAEQGVDVMFAPPVEEIYTDEVTAVTVADVSSLWEGESRPGHFDGVATVVNRLFEIFEPDKAIFGLKDLQQCAVVRKLVSDRSLPIDIVTVETVREPSGLALSSRNSYFNSDQRERASFLYKCLKRFVALSGENRTNALTVNDTIVELESHGFKVEYLARVDPVTMKQAVVESKDDRLICAARFEGVRLIDNVPCQ